MSKVTSTMKAHLSLWRVLWWQLLRFPLVIWMHLFYRLRTYGRQNVPREGPLLIVSSHQSMFDPIILGVGCRHLVFHSLARATLWRSKPLGWLMDSLNTISLDQKNTDLKALRRGVDVLKAGRKLMVFPEGGRTHDGHVGPFEPGIMLLIRRARPTILPVAIEGAFAVWPRGAKRFRLTGRLGVSYGPPIEAADLVNMEPEQALAELRDRIEVLRSELAERLEA